MENLAPKKFDLRTVAILTTLSRQPITISSSSPQLRRRRRRKMKTFMCKLLVIKVFIEGKKVGKEER